VHGDHAQAQQGRAPPAVDASAKADKGLAKEQETLLKDAGSWTAAVKMQEPGQPPVEEKGTERVEPVCAGRWMWSDFKSQFSGQPFEGHALYGYDPKEKKLVSFWIDTMTPVAMKTTGKLEEGKKAFALTGTCVDENGKPMSVKQDFTWKDDSTRVLQMEFQVPREDLHDGDHLHAQEVTGRAGPPPGPNLVERLRSRRQPDRTRRDMATAAAAGAEAPRRRS
jgi:hypothetical protein